jgi:hypothetical protein
MTRSPLRNCRHPRHSSLLGALYDLLQPLPDREHRVSIELAILPQPSGNTHSLPIVVLPGCHHPPKFGRRRPLATLCSTARRSPVVPRSLAQGSRVNARSRIPSRSLTPRLKVQRSRFNRRHSSGLSFMKARRGWMRGGRLLRSLVMMPDHSWPPMSG